MSNAQLKVQLLLEAMDKVTNPINAMRAASKGLSADLIKTKAELKALESSNLKIKSLQQTNAELKMLPMRLQETEIKAKAASQALQNAEKPTVALKRAALEAARAYKGLQNREQDLIFTQGKLSKELKESGINTAALGKAQTEMRTKLTGATQAVEKQTAALKRQAETAANVAKIEAGYQKAQQLSANLKSNGMNNVMGGVAALAPVGAAIKAHAQFETAMLGVARQVDGARDANGNYTQTYYEMSDAIQKMSERLPMAANDIAELAAAAARNGIKGKENIMAMAEVSAKASMAFDLPVGQLGDDLSKIAGLYKIPIPAIKGLGDTINYLDDQTLAKGGDIIDVMKRMGGFAEKMGASNAAAYASTLLSLGETGETAGTSMKAIVTKLGAAEKGSKSFMSAMQELGLSTSTIQKGMATDANATIQTVMDAINKMPKDQQTGILKDLFGLEHVGAAGKLANNMEELRKQVELTQAAAANGSMDKEVAARLNTLSSKWDMLKNKTVNALEKIGAAVAPNLGPLIDKMGAMAGKIANWTSAHPQLASAILTTIATIAAFSIALGLTQMALGAIISPFAKFYHMYKLIQEFRDAGGLLNIVSKIKTLGGWLSSAGSMFIKFAGMAGRAFMIVIQGAARMGMALLANPVVLIITAIAVAAFLIYRYWDKIVPFVKRIWARVSASVSEAWESIKAYVKNGAAAIVAAIQNLEIVKWFKAKWDAVIAMMSGLASVFSSIGTGIVNGLWNGLKSGWNRVTSWVTEAVGSLSDAAKKVLGINSPSRVFAGIGRDTMAGLHIGLETHGVKAVNMARKIAKQVTQAGSGTLSYAGINHTTQPIARVQSKNSGKSHGLTKAGDIHITIHAQTNADHNDIAHAVRREIVSVQRAQNDRKKSSFADRD